MFRGRNETILLSGPIIMVDRLREFRPATRRIVTLPLRAWFAFRLGSDHVADLAQHLNARREWVAIIIDDPPKLPFEGGGLFVGVHTAGYRVEYHSSEARTITTIRGGFALLLPKVVLDPER